MPLRYRSDASGPGLYGEAGIWRNNDWYEVYVPQTGQPTFANTKWCFDTIGEHFDPSTGAELDHDFSLESFESDHVLRFNGILDSDNDGSAFKISKWVPQDLRDFLASRLDADFNEGLPSVEEPEWIKHLFLYERLSPVTDLMAKTNPNVPVTDIPSLAFESLRDAPSLIYNSGQTLLGRLGSSNLNFQFGWKPLIADLRNLITFGSQVSNRLRTLQKLVRSGRLHTKASVESYTDTVTESFEIRISDLGGPFDEAFPLFVNPIVEVTKSTTIHRWGTVTYTIADEWIDMWNALPSDEKRWVSAQSAFGLHAQNPAALWEVIPWSWLIDWFIPMQELLDTYNNFVPVKVANVNVMTQEITDFSFGPTSLDWLSLEGPTRFRRTTKTRNVMSVDGELPILEKVGVQLLNTRQLGILSSIAAARRRFDTGTVFKTLPR